MRTTLTIADDVLTAAKHLAERQGKTVGEVISALARQGLRLTMHSPTMRNGVPLLPWRKGAAPVTPDLVRQLRDELPWRSARRSDEIAGGDTRAAETSLLG
jgi:hypothetical protein